VCSMMWPSYPINLADNTARPDNSTAQFMAQAIPFERINAVNGWALTPSQIAQNYDVAANKTHAKAPLVASEIGCYLSHIAAWTRIANGDAAGGFVFEDDFLADDTSGATLADLTVAQSDWDMVKLFSFDQSPKAVFETTLGTKRLVVPYRVPTCLIGYGMTKQAAQKLLTQVSPFFRPVDEDQKFFWETDLKTALVLPSPIVVGDQQTATGTIGAQRRKLKPKGLSVLWRALRYRLNYALKTALVSPRDTMKVLHIRFGKEGGAERFFVSLANAFGERGVEQHFIIRPSRTWEGLIEKLGPIWFNNYRYFSLSSFLLEWRVKRLIKTWQPDAVMAWMPRASRLIPNMDGPVKLTRLGDYPVHLRHFKNLDVLVGNQPGIATHSQDLGWDKPICTISNFARQVTPVPVSRGALDTPEDAFVISSAGRFVNRKGMDFLIRAAARVPNAYLWLIGEGKERDALEALAQSEGIAERTRFIGWVDEPIHYIAASDVFGITSRHEPLGNVVLEAWQAKVPVVATRSEGPSWYIVDGRNGVLTDIDDLDPFVAGLQKIKDDPAFGAKMVEGGSAQLDTP
jgi:glycosyltransferase involved in cell wall biosynthesis/GR25 family glycosyltransferase involved in LPS biosynthesis